ncbi:MAG: dTDP-4-dehydrorhamnose reductase [Oscillospiraceae bacterium]|nr:dTDP-4-dehydrorhamnose reductase [Oscillospiraceae bacterium]
MIIVTGAKGQLGGDVCEALTQKGISNIGIDIDDVDITDFPALERFFEKNQADAVIHCAAYTAVDKAEEEKEKCFLINAKGTENIAKCCKKFSMKLLYVSTDYVFSGKGETAFAVDDEKGPLNVYGESKLLGEKAVTKNTDRYFIVRTSWVFGEKNTNFIHTMLKLSETRDTVRVVCDQIGSPTYSRHLAYLLSRMVGTEKYGVYHATNEGFCSWHELASFSLQYAGKSTNVLPVFSKDYPSKAVRPLNSRLSKKSLDKAGFSRLPTWQDAVKEYLDKIL